MRRGAPANGERNGLESDDHDLFYSAKTARGTGRKDKNESLALAHWNDHFVLAVSSKPGPLQLKGSATRVRANRHVGHPNSSSALASGVPPRVETPGQGTRRVVYKI